MPANSPFKAGSVLFLNPRTCGIYKKGASRYKVDTSGQRTKEIDDELGEHVNQLLDGALPPGASRVPIDQCFRRRNLTPRYYDPRWDTEFDELLKREGLSAITLGDLSAKDLVTIRGGHGSPSNDQRVGNVPYIKVSDLRNLRININPTNMVPRPLAEKFWRGKHSGLQGWDLISPNRASGNIGEFVILLPGEEDVVLTKEMFVIRLGEDASKHGWDPFYLLWAFCLRSVRLQWQRVTLMQTNREDVGSRYKEIRVPVPKSPKWAQDVSEPFRKYFLTLAEAKKQFVEELHSSSFHYIASVHSAAAETSDLELAAEDVTPPENS